MKSATPKVLHAVAGRPMIGWVIEAARVAGAGRIIAVLGHGADAVQAYLASRFGQGSVGVALQAEQKGTGHAVQCALPALADASDDEVVVILTGDAPLLGAARIAELVSACEQSAAGMALLSTVPDREMPYGRLVRSAGKVERIVEHVDATPEERAIKETNAGFYAVRLGHLRRDLSSLRNNNQKGEFYLTDLVAAAAGRGGAAVRDVPFAEVAGINDRVDLAAVERVARQHIVERWMREGVTCIDPSSTYIDADVVLAPDVLVEPGVYLKGRTHVARGARIETGSVIEDCAIGVGAHIKAYSVLSETQLGEAAQVGPFSHCRPGTRLDEGVKIGNFVETKKAHFMAGAKASHLAYLGDATIGARANVGAGTITCNYDGVNKHKTIIEEGAFIGSDTQLVAPVTIGRDAFVAAGSTITQDVPRGALALTRVKQVHKEGWAERMQEARARRKKSS